MHEALLRQIPLFSPLPDAAIGELAAWHAPFHLPAGELLFTEGQVGDACFVVLDGALDVIQALGTVDERVLAARGSGELVGEMSLLNPDGRRTASVRCSATATLLPISRAEFEALLTRYPALAFELARTLSGQLQASNLRTIENLQRKNQELASAYTALQEAQAELVRHEQLARELEVARDIQLSIVPRTLPVVSGVDLGAALIPARSVGGDLFDLIPLDDDTLGIAIGDVAGKGVPAALFMALTCSLLRAEAARWRSPRRVLEAVNRQLLTMNDSSMFVTLLYGVLHRSTRRFRYARAGHEAPLVVAGATYRPVSRGLGHPLAFLADPALDEQSITLPLGSTLTLYTDGVTEAIAPDGALYGLGRLVAALRTHHNVGARPLCDLLVDAVFSYAAGMEQADDITLVTVKLV